MNSVFGKTRVEHMRYELIWLVLLCEAVSAWAVNPEVRVSQYGHTAWRIQDGFLDGVPYSIAQTADGYLWIGGATGLVRFDGVRFTPFTPPPGKHLPSPVIAHLLADRDGSLWIGTLFGLSHWTNHDLINYSSYADRATVPFFEDEDGTIWASRLGIEDVTGPLCQANGMTMRCHGKADGIPQERYFTAVRDLSGDFWLGSETGLTRWETGFTADLRPEWAEIECCSGRFCYCS